jgi:cellulose synthase/poly-beta-1,6-N-acetylglucosamine synthase-like glycosyltransferase
MTSVVIPVYNEEIDLPGCLEAFTVQTWSGNFELIFVDNGSQDRSIPIIRGFMRAHPQLDVKLLFEPHRGAAAAAQRGFYAARYDLIARTDADTIVAPNWLAAIAAGFSDDRVIALCGRVRFREPTRLQRRLGLEKLIELHQRLHIALKRPHFWGFNFAVHRQKFLEIGGFNTRLRLGEDLDLALRLQRACGPKERIRYAPELCVFSSSRRYRLSRGWWRYTLDGYRTYFNLAWLHRLPRWMLYGIGEADEVDEEELCLKKS